MTNLTRVSTAASFVTATRRIKEYADVDQATQPAILQVELGEKWAEPGVPPQAIVLRANLFLYCESSDPTTPVATAIRPSDGSSSSTRAKSEPKPALI